MNTDSPRRRPEAQAGLSNLPMSALEIFVHTDEGMAGARAFAEKRPAEFARYVSA